MKNAETRGKWDDEPPMKGKGKSMKGKADISPG
jgi:hypothetical protein